MKILIFDHLAVSPIYQKAYKKLTTNISNEVIVFIPQKWKEYSLITNIEVKKFPNYKISPIKVFFVNKFNRVIYRISIKKIRELNPDIIFVNGEPENFSTFYFAIIKRFFSINTKLVAVSWRNIPFGIKDHPYKFGIIYWLIEKFTLKNIDSLICFNKTAEEIFHNKGIKNINFIPIGVDTELFRNRKNFIQNNEKFNIGYIGRFEHSKGVHLIIEAISRLDSSYTLTLVGDGELKDYYVSLAKKYNLGEQIKFLAGTAHTEIPFILSQMDVLVLPSISTKGWIEQFGRVLIESMACEVPVIGSSSGEIPNVIENAGLIFEENNIEHLVKCIKLIRYNKKLRDTIIKLGLERVRTTYSWEIVIKQWENLFTKLL